MNGTAFLCFFNMIFRGKIRVCGVKYAENH